MSRCKKALRKNWERRYYNHIDELPVYNWWRIHQTNDYSFLLLKPGSYGSQYLMSVLWKKLYDQYFEKFGLGENFIATLEKKKEIALLKCERWITSDKSLETFIKVAEVELEEMQSLNAGDFLETKAYIEKVLNFQINMKQTSVSEFYTYLKTAIEHGSRKN